MKKLKKFAKNLFNAKRTKLLAMMLLFCTLATFAQSSAGDYTAGTNALSTVNRWRCSRSRCNLCLHRNEQRGAGCEEEDHDGRWRMYLPCSSSPGTPSVLRSLDKQRIEILHGNRTKRKSICQLPNLQGASEAPGVHGHTGTLYHLGSMCRRWSNPWFHHRVLHPRSFGWSDSSGSFPLYWCNPHLP